MNWCIPGRLISNAYSPVPLAQSRTALSCGFTPVMLGAEDLKVIPGRRFVFGSRAAMTIVFTVSFVFAMASCIPVKIAGIGGPATRGFARGLVPEVLIVVNTFCAPALPACLRMTGDLALDFSPAELLSSSHTDRLPIERCNATIC